MDPNDTPPQLETTYEWEIENFSMCPHSTGECLRSNTFYLNSIDVSEYQLVLYPRGGSLDVYETPLCLLECQKESDFRINVTMTIALEGAQMEIKKEKFLMSTREPISVKFERFKKPLEKLQFSLLPGEVFVVRCTLALVYDPQTDVRDLVTLSEDLERLYRSELFSDFCLVASDGRRFPVHKIMLTARCPELAKKAGIFDREDCQEGLILATSEALEVFLEYVYTGRLQENVASEVLVEMHSVAVEYDIDDLQREIFPLEICTVGRTIIKVDHYNVAWNIEDFRTKVEENDWPARTLIDLVVGHIVASFSEVATDDSTTTQIELMCLRSSSPLTVKCVVQVILPSDESIAILCKGEHKFYPDKPGDVFRLRGDLAFHLSHKPVREYPDTLVLVFDFRLSYPRNDSDRCNNVEGINSLDSPYPIWKRSLHRLSADLDTAYKDTYEGSDSEWRTHSDLRVGVGFGPAIPVHRCILSVRSDSLTSLINENLLSDLDNTCEIHMFFLDLRTVHNVMRYVYSGKFPQDVDVEELIPVYVTSARHQMKSLAEKCLQLIRRKVELKHIKYLLALSDNGQLRTVAVNFASKIRDSIEHTPEWADIVREMPCLASRFLLDLISAPDAPDSTTG